MAMLEDVKLALRRSDTVAFDDEIENLINAACLDLGIAGVIVDGAAPTSKTTDALVKMAIITYCKAHFGETDEYEHLKASYDEQKAQLQMAADYTDYATYGIT